jgi:hypothetical protein
MIDCLRIVSSFFIDEMCVVALIPATQQTIDYDMFSTNFDNEPYPVSDREVATWGTYGERGGGKLVGISPRTLP